MRHWSDETPRRGVAATVRRLRVAIVLSLLIHAATLAVWLSETRLVAHNPVEQNQPGGPLTARLAPAPAESTKTAPAVARPAQPLPVPKPRPPTLALRPLPTPAPAVIAQRVNPVPDIITAPPIVSAIPAPSIPVAPPPTMDLSSYIAARRRARGESDASASSGAPSTAAPAESETARRDRIVAANLASLKTPSFGNDPKNSGGLFNIKRLSSDDAEFMFFGWNKDIQRRAPQLIEVHRGSNSDIRIATVRKMISIIREHEQGDFSWDSYRLGRIIILSARASDNADLEDFLMREFFQASGVPR